jgi:hypothetical protein
MFLSFCTRLDERTATVHIIAFPAVGSSICVAGYLGTFKSEFVRDRMNHFVPFSSPDPNIFIRRTVAGPAVDRLLEVLHGKEVWDDCDGFVDVRWGGMMLLGTVTSGPLRHVIFVRAVRGPSEVFAFQQYFNVEQDWAE